MEESAETRFLGVHEPVHDAVNQGRGINHRGFKMVSGGLTGQYGSGASLTFRERAGSTTEKN